jgi:hypothetical protein
MPPSLRTRLIPAPHHFERGFLHPNMVPTSHIYRPPQIIVPNQARWFGFWRGAHMPPSPSCALNLRIPPLQMRLHPPQYGLYIVSTPLLLNRSLKPSPGSSVFGGVPPCLRAHSIPTSCRFKYGSYHPNLAFTLYICRPPANHSPKPSPGRSISGGVPPCALLLRVHSIPTSCHFKCGFSHPNLVLTSHVRRALQMVRQNRVRWLGFWQDAPARSCALNLRFPPLQMRFPPPQHGFFIAFTPPSPNRSPKLSPGLGGAPCPLPLRAHSILASHHFTCSFPNSNKVNTLYLYHPLQIVCQI